MKKSLLITLLTLIGSVLPAAAEAEKDCAAVSAAVITAVTTKPADVEKIVSEQVAANPGCACEIVKAAITAAKADKDLVGRIVLAAVTASPAEATTIAECAVAAAPEASEQIKLALQAAMSDKNPSGKNVVDKNPPPPPQDDLADFGLSPVAIGGVYLVYPSGGGSFGEVVTRTVTRTVTRPGKTRVIVITQPTPPAGLPAD